LTAECLVGWNVVCQPGYVAEEAVAAATDGLGHKGRPVFAEISTFRMN